MKLQSLVILLATLKLTVTHVLSTRIPQNPQQTTVSSFPRSITPFTTYSRRQVDIGFSLAVPGFSKDIGLHITLGQNSQSISSPSTLAEPPSIEYLAKSATDSDITLIPGCSVGGGGLVQCGGPMQALSGDTLTSVITGAFKGTRLSLQAVATASVDLQNNSLSSAGQSSQAISSTIFSLKLSFEVTTSSSLLPGTLTTTTFPVTKASGNRISTPYPTQTGMAVNCNQFYLVQDGDQCGIIAMSNGISLKSFYSWNPAVGHTCFTLQSDFYVCVNVFGGGVQAPLRTSTSQLSSTPSLDSTSSLASRLTLSIGNVDTVPCTSSAFTSTLSLPPPSASTSLSSLQAFLTTSASTVMSFSNVILQPSLVIKTITSSFLSPSTMLSSVSLVPLISSSSGTSSTTRNFASSTITTSSAAASSRENISSSFTSISISSLSLTTSSTLTSVTIDYSTSTQLSNSATISSQAPNNSLLPSTNSPPPQTLTIHPFSAPPLPVFSSVPTTYIYTTIVAASISSFPLQTATFNSATTYAFNGLCGSGSDTPGHEYQTCGPQKYGWCCGIDGMCGDDEEHCRKERCQPLFGHCGNEWIGIAGEMGIAKEVRRVKKMRWERRARE